MMFLPILAMLPFVQSQSTEMVDGTQNLVELPVEEIRYSQDVVYEDFSQSEEQIQNNEPVISLASTIWDLKLWKLKEGDTPPTFIPAMDVIAYPIRDKGKVVYISLSNRRLYAFKTAGIEKVKVVLHKVKWGEHGDPESWRKEAGADPENWDLFTARGMPYSRRKLPNHAFFSSRDAGKTVQVISRLDRNDRDKNEEKADFHQYFRDLDAECQPSNHVHQCHYCNVKPGGGLADVVEASYKCKQGIKGGGAMYIPKNKNSVAGYVEAQDLTRKSLGYINQSMKLGLRAQIDYNQRRENRLAGKQQPGKTESEPATKSEPLSELQKLALERRMTVSQSGVFRNVRYRQPTQTGETTVGYRRLQLKSHRFRTKSPESSPGSSSASSPTLTPTTPSTTATASPDSSNVSSPRIVPSRPPTNFELFSADELRSRERSVNTPNFTADVHRLAPEWLSPLTIPIKREPSPERVVPDSWEDEASPINSRASTPSMPARLPSSQVSCASTSSSPRSTPRVSYGPPRVRNDTDAKQGEENDFRMPVIRRSGYLPK